MRNLGKRLFLYVLMCMVISGTSCTKDRAGGDGSLLTEDVREAVYEEETGLITAGGLAYEVTEDVDRYTMSVFTIADYDKEEFSIPSQLEYDGQIYQVTAVGKSAFEGETNLKRIEIADGVETIEQSAFYDCTNLTGVIIPESVTAIGDYAFGECESLETLTLPEGIKTIGMEAFIHCNAFMEFCVPGSVVRMGNSVFFECEKLEKVELKEGITALSAEAFTNCTSLKEVILPDSLLSIGEEAFWDCEALTRLEIPQNVASVGERCFYTSGIKELVLYSSKIVPSEELFEGAELQKILVPKESRANFLEFFEDTGTEVETVKE